MRRRDFLAFTAGAAAWPLVARAQATRPLARLGVLLPNPNAAIYFPAFEGMLADLGWRAGIDIAIDYRWGSGDGPVSVDRAAELLESAPDVIVAGNGHALAAVNAVTADIPTVFLAIADPVQDGFVNDLVHPERNVTGHLSFAPAEVGTLMSLLKSAVPTVERAAILFTPDIAPFAGTLLQAARAAAERLGIEAVPMPVTSALVIENNIAAFASQPNGGLVVIPDGFHLSIFENTSFTYDQRDLIVGAARRFRVPSIYTLPEYAESGGLMTYGVVPTEFYRSAALYVDLLLRGARPADLPVEMPGEYQFVINLRTADALGLTIAPEMRASADRLIE